MDINFDNENDNKKNKLYSKLFPNFDNAEVDKLLIDPDSVNYISIPYQAKQISNIILNKLTELNIDISDITITDATAGTGGNTISFATYFKHVNAIEIDEIRFKYLVNNINVYKLNNITVYNDDCLKILDSIQNHDVIFIDPPWGGKDYKKQNNLKLYISGQPIETVCNNLCSTQKNLKLIVLKLPKNYDISYFYKNVNSNNKKIYWYNLSKMYILIIVNSFMLNIE